MEIVDKIEIAQLYAPRPTQFKIRKHTVEDLMSIKLDPPKRIIRPDFTDIGPIYKDPIPESRWKEAFIEYKIASAKAGLGPKLESRLDKIRWKLHRFLLRHKVII